MNYNILLDIDNILISDELISSTKNNFNKNTKNNKIIIHDDIKNKINANSMIQLNNLFISDNNLIHSKNFDHINWNKYLSKKKI
jgi:hypothetical protein